MVLCVIILILVLMVLGKIFDFGGVSSSSSSKGKTSSSNTSSTSKKKSFQSNFHSVDKKIISYEVKFFWNKDKTWYYATEKPNGVEYTYYENDSSWGTVKFGDKSAVKYYLDEFLRQYKLNGNIRLGILKNTNYLIYITSDLVIREEYKEFYRGVTFSIFETIHVEKRFHKNSGGNNRSNRSNSGSNGNRNSNSSDDVQKAFNFFKLERTVTLKDVTVVYRKYAKIYHPDRGGSAEKMAIINNNYDIIKTYFSNK